MNGNSIGKSLILTCFGESHGAYIGAVLDGCPAGLPLSESDIQVELDKRRPGISGISTPRREEDRVEIISGVYRGYT
ncbi:MAG: chorismate synthase, partial [Candidatus Bathyarchaeota archaeon]|nr:chorismate synthase [Candidatus Bathyarchaeota archaeon]